MEPEFYVMLLIGHVLGDYWFQPRSMAIQKGFSSLMCMMHCWIYASCVTCCTLIYLPDSGWFVGLIWFLFIGGSHFPIDRWSLASKWIGGFLGGDMKDFLRTTPWAGTTDSQRSMNILDGSFRAFNYAVIDNSAHLVIAIVGMKLLHYFL